MFAKICFFGVFASFVACAAAAPVAKIDVQRAAEAFVSSDQLGYALLPGRTVRDVSRRGELWIVALSPAGHVILSASDLSKPIVGFSEKDFVEPSPESPAFDFLDAASERIRRRESDETAERNSQWDALLNPAQTPSKQLLGASAVDDPATYVIVPPFLTSLFDQSQPYNDFSPLHDPSPDSTGYRGRCPCGCLATAVATAVHYFKWPARIDSTFSFNHTVTTSAGTNYFPIRFDGHNPIDWDAIGDKYDWFRYVLVTNWISATRYECWNVPRYDLRGLVTESTRFPISRLILWMDVLSKMSFGSGSSEANFYTASSALSDWYTTPQEITSNFDYVSQYLQRGIPCQVSVGKYNSARERTGGHQVVFHGWAQYGSKKLAYVNYGWGGENDGYYDIEDSFTDSKGDYFIESIWVGHVPRAKPQLDPLPTVCPSDVTLSWHFPDFYTNSLAGFTVTKQQAGTTPTTFSDDFSSYKGTSSSESIYIANHSLGDSSPLLYADYAASGTYTYPETFVLTSASVLTLDVSSYAAISASLALEARFNGGEWETIGSAIIEKGFNSLKDKVRVYVGGHGGDSAQFRLVKKWGGRYYTDENENRLDYGYVLIDNFKLTQVIPSSPSQPYFVDDKDLRHLNFSGLSSGGRYTFSVTPVFSEPLFIANSAISAETSEPVTVSIAGTRMTPTTGQETYTNANLAFSTEDTSGVWSYIGTANGSTTGSTNGSTTGTTNGSTEVNGIWNCSISAKIHGTLTSNSSLAFRWKANNYYGDGAYDIFQVKLTTESGEINTLWERTYRKSSYSYNTPASYTSQTISLSDYANLSGIITISYQHYGSNWDDGTSTGNILAPRIIGVLVPSAPENPSWESQTLVALGTPSIDRVSSVEEGFYSECDSTGTTTFQVKCSENVVELKALPSHLALVKDEDVSISHLGNGEFKVCITPSGIDSSNYRSRMILTLAASDANGTTVYKDLSLRFDKKEAPAAVTVNAQSASGAGLTVSIPQTWFTECGLAPATATTENIAELAEADSDGDGQPNWFEYICLTDPADPSNKLTCNIEVVNGSAVVTYEPSDLRSGFRTVLKGTDDLRAQQWTTVTTTTSPFHFFKVVVEHE